MPGSTEVDNCTRAQLKLLVITGSYTKVQGTPCPSREAGCEGRHQPHLMLLQLRKVSAAKPTTKNSHQLCITAVTAPRKQTKHAGT